MKRFTHGAERMSASNMIIGTKRKKGKGDDFISVDAMHHPKPPSNTVSLLEVEDNVPCPWFRKNGYKNKNIFLRLHEEILDFVHFVSPTEEEKENRRVLKRDVDAVVAELWPDAQVVVFGSTRTEMYLPTSDVDMVILGCPEACMTYHQLAEKLVEKNLVSYIEVVDGAKIPIVKFCHSGTNLQCDIAFNNSGGLATADLIVSYMQQFPAFRPLVLVLKYFLHQRSLNETFQGGVGSFLLQIMVVSFLQNQAKENVTEFVNCRMYNLGHLVVGFFHLYGSKFNYEHVGISVREGGYYFSKYSRDWQQKRGFLLAVENPVETHLDVGRNSYEIRRVTRVFEYAFRALRSEIAEHGSHQKGFTKRNNSILMHLINPDDTLLARLPPPSLGYTPIDPKAAPAFAIGTSSKNRKDKKKKKSRRN